MSNKKLILKKSAPDEIEISHGIDFHRKFKRDHQPFTVETKYADVILRSSDDFEEFIESKTKISPPLKTDTKITAEPIKAEKGTSANQNHQDFLPESGMLDESPNTLPKIVAQDTK